MAKSTRSKHPASRSRYRRPGWQPALSSRLRNWGPGRRYAYEHDFSDEWFYHAEEIDVIRMTIISASGVDGFFELPKLKAISFAIKDTEFKDAIPTTQTLIEALDEFHALPAAMRKKLLGGWEAFRWPKYSAQINTKARQPVVIVYPGARRSNGGIMAWPHLDHVECTNNVRLHVRVGTRKHDAIAAVKDLWHLLETQWDLLVCENPDKLESRPLPILLKELQADASNRA